TAAATNRTTWPTGPTGPAPAAKRAPSIPDLTAYCRMRIAAASDGRRRLAEQIVPIPLSVVRDDGAHVASGCSSLAAVLAAVDDPALLVLGPPGSGKSWLLRWLEYTLAADALGSSGAPIPILVELSRFQADEPNAHPPRPLDWLAARWAKEQPNLPSLEHLMRDGRVVFILDGLDEIPHGDERVYAQRLRAWKHFLRDDLAAHPGNRAVVSCRTMAYRVTMSTAAFPVTRVFVELLEADGVRALLARHNPERGQAVADIVLNGPLYELARRPFMAALLAQPDIDLGHLTAGHAELLSRYVREALHREVGNDNPVFTGGTVLDSHDVLRVLHARAWRTAWELPDQGALFPRLAAFALHLLQRTTISRTSRAPIAYREALTVVDHPAAADILAAANALGVLVFDLELDEVRFGHQLWQAYFAARALVDDPTPALIAAPWRGDEMTLPLAAVLAELPAGGSLPRPDESGWEDAVLFAAQMAPDAGAFVERFVEADVVLAAWAALSVASFRPVASDIVARLQQQLLDRARHPDADIRARLTAARTLGLLGDPRLPVVDGPHGRRIEPQIVPIAAGTYVIGQDGLDGGAGDHGNPGGNPGGMPAHRVALAAFGIARYPVTRAEWACFMAAGGYDDERWWDTAAGRAWRRGEGTGAGDRFRFHHWRPIFQADPSQLARLDSPGLHDVFELWQSLLTLDDAAFEAQIAARFPDRRIIEPATWSADATPNCPVSGICWYEARAYAAWLSAQTGRRYRLPTSAEWEAAARGAEGRTYATGETLVASQANYADTRIGAVTPIGLFPAGETPEGIGGLCGNVNELTSTAWGADPDAAAFPYPYAADGREAADTDPSIRRILRGGAWAGDRDSCRAALVLSVLPSERPFTLGVRLAADA
ncbi:MAG: SUMF1/EgtB/PvdO family nonheme iron enzyme, partial [Ardenticatenales bacterium]